MEILTRACGKVDVDPNNIITFVGGLPGFEDKRRFVFLGNPDDDEMIVFLQCVDDENLAFVVMQPRFFKPDYRPEIKKEEITELEAENEEELLMYAILTISSDPKKITANLKAPILINVKNNCAKQLVLHDDLYHFKTPVLPE